MPYSGSSTDEFFTSMESSNKLAASKFFFYKSFIGVCFTHSASKLEIDKLEQIIESDKSKTILDNFYFR